MINQAEQFLNSIHLSPIHICSFIDVIRNPSLAQSPPPQSRMLSRRFSHLCRRRQAWRRVWTQQTFATTEAVEVSPTVSGKTAQRVAIGLLGSVGAFALYCGVTEQFTDQSDKTTFTNWSGTHEVTPWRSFTPETQAQVEEIVSNCQQHGAKIRPVGSALSPNGIAFSGEKMLSMSLMDSVLHIDPRKKQVISARFDLLSALESYRPHGLTLQNYASIKEQQIGGFVQIGAHGTGAKIPPVDEQVISMKLVTPGLGTIELSKDDPDPTLFYLTRVGLGFFGVVTEVTLQCVPAHKLLEKTFVTNFHQIEKHHAKYEVLFSLSVSLFWIRWLATNQHLRYMWIPYTESVVVVQSNPVTSWNGQKSQTPKFSSLERTDAIRRLIESRATDGKVGDYTIDQLKELSFTQLRDVALAEDPLDVNWIKSINRAEEAYWKKSEGFQIGWSDEILGFDCGGQQWVLEVAFPTGTLHKPTFQDLAFLQEIMHRIEKDEIAAPAPIEQRWTAGSASRLSPVYSTRKDDVYSWIGIIMYLPTDNAKQRQRITEKFSDYARKVEMEILPKYNGSWHWAKIEVDRVHRDFLKKSISSRFPLREIWETKERLDPKRILSNRITHAIFTYES